MLPDEQRKQWATWAVQTVNYHFPDSAFEVWSQCQLYLPQVQNCIALIEQYKLVFPDAAQLCYKAGHYLLECAQYSSSELLLKQALEIYEQTTGSQHMEAISCLHYLATIYYILGDYDQAEILFQRTLYIRQQVLGTNHPHVAEGLNDLASLYYRQGKYAQAEMLFKQALLIWQQIFGPEHGHVAISLNNLARVCLAQVDYEQAEKLLQQALQIWTHAADNKSPDIAFALSNLAKVQQAQGKYAQAEKLFHKSLAIREKTLRTRAMLALAGTRSEQAFFQRIFERADIRVMSLGHHRQERAQPGVRNGGEVLLDLADHPSLAAVE